MAAKEGDEEGADRHRQVGQDGTWQVNAAGRQLGGMDAEVVARGLSEGWLDLEDQARRWKEDVSEKDQWTPLRHTAKGVFPVEVFVDPARAYGRRLGATAAVLCAVVTAVGGFILASTQYLEIGVGRALIILPIVVGGFFVMARLPNFIVVGGVFVIIAAIIGGIAERPLTFGSAIAVVLGGVAGMAIASGVGAALGYAVGFALGLVAGRLRAARYQVPKSRRQIPDDVVDTYSI